jgi:putative Mg2+ transporter-C (MgtC) family protein
MEHQLELILKILLATALGGFIGFERERHNRWAGLRTHVLVCMGSCLIMVTSIEMALLYGHQFNVDPGRLAAQVVSGIGFLGAGTILHSSSRIRGLTTAATLWTTAGIGLTTGLGLYLPAIATTVLAYIVLSYFGRWEVLIKRSKASDRWIMQLQLPQGNESVAVLFNLLSQYQATINSIQVDSFEEGNKVILDIQAPQDFDEPRFLIDLKQKVQVCSSNLKKC